MKKLFFIVIALFLFSTIANAQFDDLLKEVTKKVTDVELLEEKNVTTSIEDALPVAFWLKDLPEMIDPVEPESYDFNLEPGYYTFKLQSYCLKAGTHGPTKGYGYLLAPLLGKRSDLVYNIVSKSVNHPEIAQQDIQVLLWGIIYGAKFTDYSLDFQNRVRPLLTAAEIVDLSLDLKNIPLDIMPDDIKAAAQYYKDLRGRLTNPSLTYDDISRYAMAQGIAPPEDPFSKYIEKGLWAHIGNGFYSRAIPDGYPTTNLELYRPAYISTKKDNMGRITLLENNGYKIEISYDDEPGRDAITFDNNTYYPVWRYTSIKLSGEGEEMVLDNPGWMVKGNGEALKEKPQILNNEGGAVNDLNSGTINDDPDFGEYKGRIDRGKKTLKDFDEYRKEKKLQDLKNKQSEYWADYHTMEGLKAATNPLNKKGQMNWIQKTLNIVTDWWNSSSGALAGDEGSIDNGKKKVIISKFPAVPATNGMQRIISSERKK
ncbi:MAG: hypothetical protein JW917_10075 [Ignavibacteria bacterium]|nr:hypothetical protein [Ignavibacteria bacterium]